MVVMAVSSLGLSNLSRSFTAVSSIQRERYADGLSWSPFSLLIRTNFCLSGNILELRQSLYSYISRNSLGRFAVIVSKTSVGNLSGPGELFGFSLLSTSFSSSVVKKDIFNGALSYRSVPYVGKRLLTIWSILLGFNSGCGTLATSFDITNLLSSPSDSCLSR